MKPLYACEWPISSGKPAQNVIRPLPIYHSDTKLLNAFFGNSAIRTRRVLHDIIYIGLGAWFTDEDA